MGGSAAQAAEQTNLSRLHAWPPSRRVVAALAAVSIGLLLAELDQAVFAAALPTIVGELGGLYLQLWVGTGYVLAGAVIMPVIGRLGDVFGRRLIFSIALAVFFIGSVLGGLADSMIVVVIARVVQGLGGGGLLILVEALVADLIPPRRRALVLSGVGAVFAVAAVAGPVVGGALTSTIGWRWAFWLNLPLIGAALMIAWRVLPAKRPGRASAFDLTGALLLTVCLASATMAITALSNPAAAGWSGWLYGGLALLSLIALIRVERRAVEPILPAQVFRHRALITAVSAGAVLAVAMFGTISYLPTYLQMVHGLSPSDAGLFLLTLVAGIGAATVIAGQFVSRTGRAHLPPVLGGVLVSLALISAARLTPETPLVVLAIGLVVLGLGIGCAWEVLVVVVQDCAPAADVGAATAVNGFTRELGVVVGTALVGAAFTAGIVGRLAAAGETAVSPMIVNSLSVDRRAEIARAYADAFAPVCGWLALPAVLATVGLFFLPRRQLVSSAAVRPGMVEEVR